MTRTKLMQTISSAAVLAALTLSSTAADAARCFGRDTSALKAGNTTVVRGPDVGVKKTDAADFARPNAGDDVFGGDRVKTGDNSMLQLKLCDWSTYTFSPGSESNINEFYSADGAERRRVVNYVRGGLKLLSGRETETDTEVKFQESGVTMGVRGTGVVVVELDGLIYVLLEGPGLDNDGLAQPGLVDFTDDQRNEIVAKLSRPGFAVTIGPDGVSDPFMPDNELLKRIYAAFTPALLAEDGADPGDLNGDSPEDISDQDEHRTADDIDDTEERGDQENKDTDDIPDEINDPTSPPPPPGPEVGDILTLPQFEDFAEAQANPDGHFLALASVQFTIENSNGTFTEEGVALIQMHFDFASRTIAPEALASFAVLDDTAVLGSIVPDFDEFLDDDMRTAIMQAVLANIGFAFSSGQGGLAVYETPLYTFTVRQGAGNTITIDVDVHFETPVEGGTLTAAAEFRDLMLQPGAGDLAYFTFELGRISSIAEFTENLGSGSGTTYLAGFNLANSTSASAGLNGNSFGQLLIDFDNRTIGGGESYLAMSAANGGEHATGVVRFNNTTPWSAGLFDLAFYPLPGLTDDDVKGEVAFDAGDGLFGFLAAIIGSEQGQNLYSQILIQNTFNEGQRILMSIGEVEDLEFTFGESTLHYDGTFGNGAAFIDTGDSFFFNNFASDVSASIDVNFANRTLGGGESHIQLFLQDFNTSATFYILEFLRTVSFDEAVNGEGVFGFDTDDFSPDPFDDSNDGTIESVLLLLKSSAPPEPQPSADIYFRFSDGNGHLGEGRVEDMFLSEGQTQCPNCN